ncbi:MAG TPA: hypothetical protein DCR25_06075, partial [Rhodobacter sp.]|nr:hypothetical protein [Rhodobacter sp.]
HYGWFERASRGLYRLSTSGKTAADQLVKTPD